MEFVASMAEQPNIILEPAEDEIAAINMVIGASFAGVRAMTATSGEGFCLMVDGLGLAPGNAGQAFHLSGKAFNMADKYQAPMIVLGDQHLNDSYFTIDELDLGQIHIDRGRAVFDDKIPSVKDYKRYAWDDSGISPRILPGQSEAVLYADSDEHTEVGHITESAHVRKQMRQKRMRKLEGMRQETEMPVIYPSENSDVLILGWGSTYGAMKEAVEIMNRDGLKSQMVHFSEIYPFPSKDFSGEISHQAKVLAVECNYTGQFAELFKLETGISIHHKILKYDGRPFSPKEIVSEVKARL